MIYPTDVQAVQKDGGSAGTIIDSPCRVKAVYISYTSNEYGVVDLYDATSVTGTPALRIVNGKGTVAVNNYVVSNRNEVRIPGNGIRFDTAVHVDFPSGVVTSGDQVLSITVVYQGAVQS